MNAKKTLLSTMILVTSLTMALPATAATLRVHLEFEDEPNPNYAWNSTTPSASVPLTIDSAGSHWTRKWPDNTSYNLPTRSSESAIGNYSYHFDAANNQSMAVRLQADASDFEDDTYLLMRKNFTLAFWMNADTWVSGRILTRSYAALDYRGIWIEQMANGNLRVRFQDNSSNVVLYDIAGINTGEWNHIAVTLDATDGMKWYLDGTLVHSNPVTGFEPFFNDRLFLATDSAGNNNYTGYLDDLRIYDGALSGAQIMTLIPEPSSLALLALAGLALMCRNRRR